LNIDEAGTIGSITGTATQGQTLTAGTVSDPDGTVSGISYQWKANGNNITGANSSTYTLTQAEVSKAITVVATYTDPLGSGKTVTSAATSAVMETADLNPRLSTNLSDSVTNLDVTSNLVFTSDKALSFGSGSITITDLGGKTAGGFRGDVNTNTQTIDLNSPAGQALISFSADKKTVTINPTWDLDLSSNYRISIGKGAFVSGDGASEQLDVDFGTVTPGTGTSTGSISNAVASSKMNAAGGLDANNRWWFDAEGIGNATTSMTQLGDLANKSYVLVVKNYAVDTQQGSVEAQRSGIRLKDTNVGVINFGADDQLYYDSQVNNSTLHKYEAGAQSINPSPANYTGALPMQQILLVGLTANQEGSSAFFGLGLEGNPNNEIFSAIYERDAFPELGLFSIESLIGIGSQPVIMA
jgi:hypothetical protein